MAARRYTRFRVEMARNFRRFSNSVWFMAQDDALDLKVAPPIAVAKFGRFRIVVPANPDPFFGKGAKRGERPPVGVCHALARAPIMKTVTEANDPRRPISLDDISETSEGVVAVERWDKPASRRRVGALLQMQIGNDERSLSGKPSCSAVIERQSEARKCHRDRRTAWT